MAVVARKYTDAVDNAISLALNGLRGGLPLIFVNCGVSAAMSGGTGTVTVTSGMFGSLTGKLAADAIILYNRATTGGTLGNLSAPVASITANQFVMNSSAAETSTMFWAVFLPAYHKDVTSLTTGSFDSPAAANLASSIGTASVTLASAISVTQQLDLVYRTHLADTAAHVAADTTNVPSPAIATVVDQASLNTYLNALQTSYNAHLTQAGVHLANDAVNTNATTVASTLATSITLVNALAASLLAHMARAVPGQGLSLTLS